MRSAIVLVVAVCGACTEPVGRTQEWPPSRGIVVEGIAAGDLDGDGAPEVVVLSSGDGHQAGLYLIDGRADLALGTGFPIATFTAFTPLEVTHPAAVTIVPGSPPTVLGAYIDDFFGLTERVFDTTLDEQTYFYDEQIDDNSALLWQRPVRFPGNMQHVIASNGVSMQHFDLDTADAEPVPAPNMQPWMTAETATSYTSGADLIIVVATPTAIVQAPLPTTTETMLPWSTVRSGAGWLGQTALDLGTGHEVIVGVDSVAHQVCADDPATPGEHCIALPGTSANTEIAMVLVPTATGRDLVITLASATATDVSVIANVTLDAGGLGGTGDAKPTEALPHGRPLIVNAGAGTPARVLVMAADGHVKCVSDAC